MAMVAKAMVANFQRRGEIMKTVLILESIVLLLVLIVAVCSYFIFKKEISNKEKGGEP